MHLFTLAVSPLLFLRELTQRIGYTLSAPFRFTNHIPLYLEYGDYEVRTANTWFEFLQVLKLRYLCFIEDEGLKKKLFKLDWDSFDFKCDHLLIVNKEKKEMVGTYRLNCSLYNDKFYSSKEFNIQDFIDTPGVKVELGRACVRPAYRGGIMVDLLWKGLGAYIKDTGARYLFGCSSFFSNDRHEAQAMVDFVKSKDLYGEEFKVMTKDLKMLEPLPKKDDASTFTSKQLPPLLRTYMAAGAKVYGQPYYDADFECFDFFTIIDSQKISRLFHKRYFSEI